MAKPTAVVIGAGIAGIAASIRLALKGYQVLVLEANSYPGGKLTAFEQGGYRFDAGPSLFTEPEQVDALFRLAGEKPRAHFTYQRLEEVCRYQWPDGTQLTAAADPKQFAAEIENKLGVPTKAIHKLLAKAQRIYEITSHVFLDRSLHNLATYLRWPTLVSILRLGQIDAFRTLHTANQAALKDPRLVQLFDRYATYNGSDPYRAPATLGVIPHLEFSKGAFFPTGGMHQITLALVGLAERLGVQFLYNQPVSEILLNDRQQVLGVRLGEELVEAKIVISNMDLVGTYRKLLPGIKPPEKLLTQEKSTSGLIFYWGVRGEFPQLGLHNIFYSNDYKGEFQSLFEQKTIPADPTIYLNISAKKQPGDAPADSENWFVMVNTPPDDGTQDWDSLIEHARATILRKLEHALGIDSLQALIESESILEPRLIAQCTSSWGGSLYGNASNSLFAAFLRHPNRSRSIPGLYFVGGSVHPGGGIPLCLRSAKIAVDQVPKA